MKTPFLICLIFMLTNTLFGQWSNNPSVNTPIISGYNFGIFSLSVPDTSGGTIIIANSFGDSTNNIYVQKVNRNGIVQFGNSLTPKQICSNEADRYLESVLPDGIGGAYICWMDKRRSPDSNDVYLQHINSNGNTTWAQDGVKANIRDYTNAKDIRLCSDGGTGVIVAWTETVYDSAALKTMLSEIMVQRFNIDGIAQWDEGGVFICSAFGLRIGSSIVADGSGGAIIAFTDTRNSNQAEYDEFDNTDIYAQRINKYGLLLWTDEGKPVCTEPFNQVISTHYPQITSSIADGSGSAVLLFDNQYADNYDPPRQYAQSIDGLGTIKWNAAGIAVSKADEIAVLLQALPDGNGGIIAFWEGYLSGSGNAYTQRILANGTVAWAPGGVVIAQEFGSGQAAFVQNDINNHVFCWLGADNFLRAQKININGVKQWSDSGALVCNNPDALPDRLSIVKSTAGETIITWSDYRTSFAGEIYGAKLDSSGKLVQSQATGFTTLADGNWNNAAIWVGGKVPPPDADVIIKNSITVTSNVVCNSLTVEPPNGKVTVNSGVNLTISH